MLSRFSVKKPWTVIVALVLVLILGVVSFMGMKTDLFPSMDLPYVVVYTTYPGANPEKVEQSVTKPLEQTLAAANGIENITSVSSENVSMVILQFTEDTNMDSAMIELSNSLDLVKSALADGVGSPTMIKMNPDMLPVMVASADIDGMDVREASEFVRDKILPELERINGVASVTTTGMVESQLKITLDQDKIDALNQKVLDAVDSQLADAKTQLDQSSSELEQGRAALEEESTTQTQKLLDAEKQLKQGKEQLEEGREALRTAQSEAQQKYEELLEQKAALDASIEEMQGMGIQPPAQMLETQQQLAQGVAMAAAGISEIQSQLAELDTQNNTLLEQESQLEAAKLTLTRELTRASVQLDQGEAQLKEAQEQFEKAEQEAYQKADLSGVITKDMISQILTAQNFSMPAGSITEGEDSISVKVGDSFQSVEELENLVIFDISAGDIGAVTLSDVAEIGWTDDADEMYAKINGNDGILLSFTKQSNMSTTEVSDNINQAIETITQKYEGLHLTPLQDQGVYINIVIDSVLSNLLLGGLLAVLILLVFLRDIKPTLIIAISIPSSLMFAITLMYFTGVDINVISLAGLALGVGMLVDNSIVAIENIYRLRRMGYGAADAAVKGASQIAGAITASTLTTICVFLPIVFTEGMTRELFTDMGLTIAYSLLASLIVALTLVPTISSFALRRQNERQHRWFERFTGFYGRMLERALHHRFAVLAVALVLLIASGVAAAFMGTEFIPSMGSSQMSVTMEMPKGSTTEETREMSDTVLERINTLDEVETVGAMESSSMSMMGGGSGHSISMYVLLRDGYTGSDKIAAEIREATADLDCELSISTSSADMSMLVSSGVQLQITGSDLDELRAISQDMEDLLAQTEGLANISSELDEAPQEIRITVDKNKAMQYNLTIAQVYQEIAALLSETTEATTITLDSVDYDVVVSSDDAGISYESLQEYSLTGTQDEQEVSVPLNEIAEIERVDGFNAINHDNQERIMTVKAEVADGYNIGLVSRDLEEKLNSYEVPNGYRVEMKGENETINESLFELIKMIALAIVFIYMIMVAQFQSLKSPFIVMFTIPLAFTGGLLALWITGSTISITSMLGFLVLSGVVVNNGIVFVDCVNQLRLEGMEKREALLQAGKTRIRPILMTAITTILGLSTMALGIGSGAEMLQGMAIVTIGGLSYATLLTLFVVPVLYDLFNRRALRKVVLEDDSLGEQL